MIKSLNCPVARCVAECHRRLDIVDSDDDVLDCEVLLCHGQRVLLTCNLWVESSLVNGAIGFGEDIFYSSSRHPHQLP